MTTGLTFNIFGHDVSASTVLDQIPATAKGAGTKAGASFSNEFTSKWAGGFADVKNNLAKIPPAADAAGGKAGDQFASKFAAGFADVKTDLAKIAPAADQAGSKAGQEFSNEFADQAKEGFGELKDKMGDLVGGLGLAATVGTALKGAWDNNQNQFKLQAALGLSPAQARKDAKTASGIYANAWGESLDDVDAAVGAVRKSLGNLNQTKLANITTQALAFQQTFGPETTESINAVSQMLRTGLAKNAQEAFDVLTTGEQSGVDKAGDLIDTFNEYGTQFRKLGLDGKTALGLLQQGIQGGARDSDVVADALKEFSLRTVGSLEQMDAKGVPHLTALGQAFSNMLPHGSDIYAFQKQLASGGEGAKKGLGVALDYLRKIKDPAMRAQTAVTLFGTQAEDLGGALFKLDPATASAAKGMSKIDGAGKRLTDSIGKTTSPLESLERSATATLAKLGANALPILRPLLALISHLGPELAAVATGFAAWYAVSKLTAFTKGFGEAVSALGVKFGITTAATEAETVAQGELDAAMDANPIGLIVAALAALAVGLVLAWKHSKTFRDVVKGVFDKLKEAALFLWNKILKPIFEAWRLQFHILAVALRAAWTGVIKPVWDALRTTAQFVWYQVLKRIFDAYKTEWRILSSVFRAVWANGVRPVINAVATVWQTTWEVMKAVYSKIKDGIRGVRDVIRTVVGVIKGIWHGLGAGLQAVWDHSLGPVIDTIKSAIGWIVDKVNSVIGKIRWLASHMPKVPGGGGGLGSVIKAGFGAGFGPVGGLVGSVFAQGTGFAPGGVSLVGDRGPELVRLPIGAQVLPATTARSQLGGGDTYNVTLHMPGQFYGSPAEFGRAAAAGLEAAANQGVKMRIGKAVVG